VAVVILQNLDQVRLVSRERLCMVIREIVLRQPQGIAERLTNLDRHGAQILVAAPDPANLPPIHRYPRRPLIPEVGSDDKKAPQSCPPTHPQVPLADVGIPLLYAGPSGGC